MPLTLHPHLKRRLDQDDFYLDPADTIEDLPRERRDTEEQAAKRQRVEKIASHYLQGRLPVILTASLCGPFNHGWNNPWAKPKKAKRRVSDKEDSLGGEKKGIGGKAGVRKAKPTEPKRRTRSAGRRALKEQAVASLDILRAIHSHVDEFQESHTLDVVEVPPATAPSPQEHDTSGVTEFFSGGTERCVRRRSPLTDPFWLRRPESQRKVDVRASTNSSNDISPTRTRGTFAQPDRRRTLQLAVPRVPVGIRASPSKAAVPEDISSSASASMVISSPTKPSAPIEHAMDPLSQSQGQRPSTGPIQTPVPGSEMQPAQVRSAAVPVPTPAPATAYKIPLQEGPTREVIQRSAERLVNVPSASQPPNSQSNRAEQADAEVGPRQSQDNHVAPPMPDSSTGFVYKKVGSTKWSISNAPRSKPRAVNFNSSPATKDVAITSKPSSQSNAVVERDAPGVLPVAVEEGPQSEKRTNGSQTNEPVQEHQSLRSSRSSRQSAMSTQAAMLRAQLEFQESTFPTSSSGTFRPWSQPEEKTPRPMLPEPSPAITPLSVFRPQLEQGHALTSVLRGPPLSTQDLFAAASPFAFSTAKKKSEAPQRSNLRMSMMSLDDQDEYISNASPQSPFYSDRIPLKEKNAAASPWRFSFEKEPRSSQDFVQGQHKAIH